MGDCELIAGWQHPLGQHYRSWDLASTSAALATGRNGCFIDLEKLFLIERGCSEQLLENAISDDASYFQLIVEAHNIFMKGSCHSEYELSRDSQLAKDVRGYLKEAQSDLKEAISALNGAQAFGTDFMLSELWELKRLLRALEKGEEKQPDEVLVSQLKNCPSWTVGNEK